MVEGATSPSTLTHTQPRPTFLTGVSPTSLLLQACGQKFYGGQSAQSPISAFTGYNIDGGADV